MGNTFNNPNFREYGYSVNNDDKNNVNVENTKEEAINNITFATGEDSFNVSSTKPEVKVDKNAEIDREYEEAFARYTQSFEESENEQGPSLASILIDAAVKFNILKPSELEKKNKTEDKEQEDFEFFKNNKSFENFDNLFFESAYKTVGKDGIERLDFVS